MTELITPKKRSYLLPVALGIVALLMVGFVASRAGLDKALVKQKLDAAIASIKKKGREDGRDIEIKYGDLEVSGSFIDKHVIVHQPVFIIKPLEHKPLKPGAEEASDSLVVTSDEMVIYPKSVDLSSATFSLPKPINFATENAPEKSLLLIQSNTPLEVTITQKNIAGAAHTLTSHTLPGTIDFTYLREQKAVGVEDATPTITPVYDMLTMRTTAGSVIETDLANDDSGHGSSDISIGQITLTPKSAPEGVVTIEGIKGHWINALNDKKNGMMQATANVGPITAPPSLLPYAPIAFELDFYSSEATSKAAQADAEAEDSSIVLKKLELTTKDATLSAAANFTANASDTLPVGTASVKLSNMHYVLSELRKNSVLTPEKEEKIVPILEKIAGASLASLADLDIVIKRERGGAFMIGKTTFEELFAMVLKQAMQGKNPSGANAAQPAIPVPDAAIAPQSRALVPQLPPADKPKLAPIAIPDNGVRG